MLQNAKKQVLLLEGKILLGLSGGPDSMALASLLLACKKVFHIAHIDHSLQKGSEDVKKRCEDFANKHGIPFHSLKLDPHSFDRKNLEDVLRQKRLSFFKEVMEKEGCDTLVLGHQKDERAETVLKRFFEGGSLANLSGIKEKTCYERMKIARPLLSATKKEIIKYLTKADLFYYTDPTNMGDGNLRARMRSRLLPMIEKEFGKGVVAPISDLADQADRFSSYLDREIEKMESNLVTGPFGSYLRLDGIDLYLIEQFVFRRLGHLNREQRREISSFVERGVVGKSLLINDELVCFEGFAVFFMKPEFMVKKPKGIDGDVDWQELFVNGFDHSQSIDIEESEIDLKRLSEYHRQRQTPHCLRKLAPIPLTTMSKKSKIIPVK